MPSWPVSLPDPLVNGYQESFANNVIRTQMDQGPDKIRRRTTANVSLMNLSFLFSTSQMSDFEDFYINDISYGALAFDYDHPRTGDTVSCRFRKEPDITFNGVDYTVSAQIEILP